MADMPRGTTENQRFRTVAFRCLAAMTACFMLAAAGCGRGHGASVSGEVTLDGKPLDRGTVAFHPVDDGPTAYGGIHPNGTYQLKTGAGGGLAPGEYRVTVLAMTDPPTDGPSVPGERITPLRYANPEESDLMYTVGSGSNWIDLKLVTAGAPP